MLHHNNNNDNIQIECEREWIAVEAVTDRGEATEELVEEDARRGVTLATKTIGTSGILSQNYIYIYIVYI